MVLISVTFRCASYISYSTRSKAKSFVMYVNAVLLFCYRKLLVVALSQYGYLKQFSVSHEYNHSDDYFPEQFMFFLPSVGCAVTTLVSYFPFNYVEVWTGFVWLMIGTLNMLRPSLTILCERSVLCFGLSFVLVILYIAMH